jgi:hypothetical protein
MICFFNWIKSIYNGIKKNRRHPIVLALLVNSNLLSSARFYYLKNKKVFIKWRTGPYQKPTKKKEN